MKLLVCGGRDFTNYKLLSEKIEKITINHTIDTLISGCAKGADSLTLQWAQEKKIKVNTFPAKWDKYGRGAGFIRNLKMLNEATHVIAFWDGKSKGTEHSILNAKKMGLPLRIVHYTRK